MRSLIVLTIIKLTYLTIFRLPSSNRRAALSVNKTAISATAGDNTFGVFDINRPRDFISLIGKWSYPDDTVANTFKPWPKIV